MKSQRRPRKRQTAREPWYIQAFKADYLGRYRHRSDEQAAAEIAFVRKVLNLPRGARILDLCCGAGRHSRPLAAAGYEVIGIDLSADLLRAARKSGGRIRYVRADMRKLPLEDSSVDGAINMFTSFGYFASDRENARVLDEAGRVLKSGAPFLMDYMNLTPTLEALIPQSRYECGRMIVLERRRFDRRKRRLQKTIERREGASRQVFRESLRAYSSVELKALFKSAGFKIVKMFGDLSGAKFVEHKSPRCVILARKSSDRK